MKCLKKMLIKYTLYPTAYAVCNISDDYMKKITQDITREKKRKLKRMQIKEE